MTKFEQFREIASKQLVVMKYPDGTCREAHPYPHGGFKMEHRFITERAFNDGVHHKALCTLRELNVPIRQDKCYTGEYDGTHVDFMFNHDPRFSMLYLKDGLSEEYAREVLWCKHQVVRAFDRNIDLMNINCSDDGNDLILAMPEHCDWFENFIPLQTHELVPIKWEES